jgi:hypothetical protein
MPDRTKGGVAESLVLAEYADTFVAIWEIMRPGILQRRVAFGRYTTRTEMCSRKPERRQLGGTGLSVTTLGFGAIHLGGPPAANEISDDESDRVLNAVLDSGINFIDTAVCYGASEARIGRAISHRRREFLLATKCGCLPGMPMSTPHVHTAANIRAGVAHDAD